MRLVSRFELNLESISQFVLTRFSSIELISGTFAQALLQGALARATTEFFILPRSGVCSWPSTAPGPLIPFVSSLSQLSSASSLGSLSSSAPWVHSLEKHSLGVHSLLSSLSHLSLLIYFRDLSSWSSLGSQLFELPELIWGLSMLCALWALWALSALWALWVLWALHTYWVHSLGVHSPGVQGLSQRSKAAVRNPSFHVLEPVNTEVHFFTFLIKNMWFWLIPKKVFLRKQSTPSSLILTSPLLKGSTFFRFLIFVPPIRFIFSKGLSPYSEIILTRVFSKELSHTVFCIPFRFTPGSLLMRFPPLFLCSERDLETFQESHVFVYLSLSGVLLLSACGELLLSLSVVSFCCLPVVSFCRLCLWWASAVCLWWASLWSLLWAWGPPKDPSRKHRCDVQDDGI